MPKLPVRFVRGLRFRLTLSYVLFFTLLLIGIGLFYRQILQKQLEGTEQAALEELWPVAREYFNIEKEEPVWSTDPDDAEVVGELRRAYLIADADGNALDYNEDNDSISFSASEVKTILRRFQSAWGSRRALE